jgi:hypothetical protein
VQELTKTPGSLAGIACDDCWKVTHDWQTDDKEGRSAFETSETISQSTLDNMKEDLNPQNITYFKLLKIPGIWKICPQQ